MTAGETSEPPSSFLVCRRCRRVPRRQLRSAALRRHQQRHSSHQKKSASVMRSPCGQADRQGCRVTARPRSPSPERRGRTGASSPARAFDGDRRRVGHSIDYDQWFGGERVPCAGIARRAVLPEYRGQAWLRQSRGDRAARTRARGRAISDLPHGDRALSGAWATSSGGARPQFRCYRRPSGRPWSAGQGRGGGGGGGGGGGEVRTETTDLDPV